MTHLFMENKVYENIEHETETKQLNQITSIANDPNLYETPEGKSLGERIREARKAKGLTQKQLAEFLQINQSSVASLESGRSKPDIQTQKLLCQHFNFDLSFFDPSYSNISSDSELWESS